MDVEENKNVKESGGGDTLRKKRAQDSQEGGQISGIRGTIRLAPAIAFYL